MVSMAAIPSGKRRRHERCHGQRLEQHDGRKVAFIENAGASDFCPMVAAQEGIPHDPRISDERDNGSRVSVSESRRGDQGRARLARVVQLREPRGRYGLHGCGGRKS